VLVARRPEPLERLAARLPTRAVTVVVDLSTADGVAAARTAAAGLEVGLGRRRTHVRRWSGRNARPNRRQAAARTRHGDTGTGRERRPAPPRPWPARCARSAHANLVRAHVASAASENSDRHNQPSLARPHSAGRRLVSSTLRASSACDRPIAGKVHPPRRWAKFPENGPTIDHCPAGSVPFRGCRRRRLRHVELPTRRCDAVGAAV
jgi:hypothetical protein